MKRRKFKYLHEIINSDIDMTEWTTMRNYKLWIGMALMGLSIYLIIKLYDSLFLSLKVPIVAVGPDGALKVIGSIQPFTSPVLAYDIIMSIILTAILSSIASILIYSSLVLNSKYRDNVRYRGNLMVNIDNHDNSIDAISSIALSSLERKALQSIRKRGGMMTQAELGRELGLSKYQVSRLVKRLEAKGIIERRRAGVTNVLILHNGLNTLDKLSKNKD
ncbi:MAG: helix-turn-helix transcriptional regulator [Vulcanisaeta sp.]|jgi:hypothetical protein|uniref:helix-turn-helix transcriptional regulator n=1 Tax=Vulcanisaeta sp. TaxID=2020871 RepID=UPI003D0AEB63